MIKTPKAGWKADPGLVGARAFCVTLAAIAPLMIEALHRSLPGRLPVAWAHVLAGAAHRLIKQLPWPADGHRRLATAIADTLT